MINFEKGTKLVTQVKMRFDVDKQTEHPDVVHPLFSVEQHNIDLPPILEADEKLEDIIIDGIIAFFFTDKRIIRWQMINKYWIKETPKEGQQEADMPIFQQANTFNLISIAP